MQLNDVVASIIIGFLGFLGALLGVIVSNLVTARLAAQERKEARRKEYLQRLIGLSDALIRVRAKLQWVQSETDPPEREVAYGEAYAVMLSTADTKIVTLAEKVMRGQGHGGSRNEKIDAIDEALRLIGESIKKILDEDK